MTYNHKIKYKGLFNTQVSIRLLFILHCFEYLNLKSTFQQWEYDRIKDYQFYVKNVVYFGPLHYKSYSLKPENTSPFRCAMLFIIFSYYHKRFYSTPSGARSRCQNVLGWSGAINIGASVTPPLQALFCQLLDATRQ